MERRGAADLADVIVRHLVAHDVRFVSYLPDHMLDGVVDRIRGEERFTVVVPSREDEGLGILTGAHLGGRRGAMFMQSSGFGLCLNALASVALPYQVPFLMVVSLRGDLGEFNVCQMRMGQAVADVCRDLGVPCVVPADLAELDGALPRLLETCFSVELPVCLAVRRPLLGQRL